MKTMCKWQYFLLQIESTGSEVALSDTHPQRLELQWSGLFPLLLLYANVVKINPLKSLVFGSFWTSSGIFGYAHVVFKKTQHSQDKNLTPITQKKLAGIYQSSLSLPKSLLHYYSWLVLSFILEMYHSVISRLAKEADVVLVSVE